MARSELLVTIEKLRWDLVKLIEDKRSLTDPEVIAANRSLNRVIVQYHKSLHESNPSI